MFSSFSSATPLIRGATIARTRMKLQTRSTENRSTIHSTARYVAPWSRTEIDAASVPSSVLTFLFRAEFAPDRCTRGQGKLLATLLALTWLNLTSRPWFNWVRCSFDERKVDLRNKFECVIRIQCNMLTLTLPFSLSLENFLFENGFSYWCYNWNL